MDMKERLIATGDFTARELECATPHELFEFWCNYEGLIGYADDILSALEDCGYRVSAASQKVVKCIELYEMPFDKGGVHATGNYVQFDNGDCAYEYEDSNFEYSDACVYEYEDEDGSLFTYENGKFEPVPDFDPTHGLEYLGF